MTTMQDAYMMRDSHCLLDKPHTLRQRAQQDGYVFIKAAIPSALLWDLREQIAEILVTINWCVWDGQHLRPRPGQKAICETSSADWRTFYDRVQCLPAFHALVHHRAFQSLADAICGGPSFFHPRHICRLVFPFNNLFTTPPHQDYFYINGAVDTWTMWIPLGDCPRALGSLAVLPASHKNGLLPVHAAQGAGGHACDVEDNVWHFADFTCGDVLCLHSMLIHQGQDNATDCMRLSMDVRFQLQSDQVHATSLQPHLNILTWPQIYQQWQGLESIQYYWQKYDLDIIPS